MSANCAKSYFLILAVDFVEETFMSECAIIGVIVLDGAIGLRHDFFEGLNRQERFVHRIVAHQMNINIVTDVIAKGGTTPNAATCEETRHLWY